MASFRYVVADAFTDTPLQGNQVAVFTDARGIPEELLQPLAREMNYSETVFVLPKEADGHVRVRIFTPGVELPFAGHPILGTAFVLAAPLQLEVIRLETGAGTIPVALERDGDRIVFGWMEQSFPPGAAYPGEAGLLAALGVERSELPVESYLNGPEHVYVCLGSKEQVAALRPDLGRLPPLGINCFAGEGRSWKTRLFAPGLGVAEDPATGSAAGPLAVHLARHGRIGWDDEIEIEQGTEIQRRSTLFARAVSEGAARVGGSAVVVARGEFRL